MIARWLAPVDIALGLGSPIDEVLDALAALGLTESRAHSRVFWIWHVAEVPHYGEWTAREMSEQGEWLTSGWDIVEEAVGDEVTIWRCARKSRVYSPAAVSLVRGSLAAWRRSPRSATCSAPASARR
jgi:hypothetical protein